MIKRGSLVVAAFVVASDIQPFAQPAARPAALSERIDAILARPEFKHATFGIEFYSLDTNKPVYTLNADKLFVPGSTTKLITMGSALQLLGPDYRFHTRVYRTGDVDRDGTLHGDRCCSIAAKTPSRCSPRSGLSRNRMAARPDGTRWC